MVQEDAAQSSATQTREMLSDITDEESAELGVTKKRNIITLGMTNKSRFRSPLNSDSNFARCD